MSDAARPQTALIDILYIYICIYVYMYLPIYLSFLSERKTDMDVHICSSSLNGQQLTDHGRVVEARYDLLRVLHDNLGLCV